MPLYDFKCNQCGNVEEEIVDSGVLTVTCVQCGGVAERIYLTCPKQLTVIIPDYPGCKKHRAGYVHTHADRPATKVLGKGWSAP